MRKLIVLLWVTILPITSIIAQSNEEKQEAYDQLKEWAVVKLTIAYIEDLRQFTPEEKGNNGSKNEYKTYTDLINHYQDFSNEINLDSIAQLLVKGDWKVTKENVFDSYRKIDFTPDINFKKIEAAGFKEGMSVSNFNRTIKDLNNKYEELLNDLIIAREEQQSKNNNNEKSIIDDINIVSKNDNQTRNTRDRTSSFSDLLVGGILVSLLAALSLIHI